MKRNPYRTFSVFVFLFGVVLAVVGPMLLTAASHASWDAIFPPPDPRLTDPQLIALRNDLTVYFSRWLVWVGLLLVIMAIPNWIRASRQPR